MQRTGSVDLRVNQRGRKAKLTQENINAINALLQERPDITIREIKETLNLNVCLLPALNPGEIVIMDNLAAHHAPQVAQLIQQAGPHLLYLPPYSPNFNPIEKLWSKVKAYLRKCRVLTFDALEKFL